MRIASTRTKVVPIVLGSMMAACTSAPVATTSTTSAPASEVAVVLDAVGCDVEGSVEMPGALIVTLDNQTTAQAFFELLVVGPAGTHDDLAAHIAAEAGRLAAGEPMEGPPGYVTVVARTEVAPGSADVLDATVDPGPHAVVCGEPGATIFVTGPIAVSDP